MDTNEYRKHIDRLIREMNGELVLNGSHSHATIILERMFAHAKENVSILSRRLDPRIYGTVETVEQAELFLGEKERSIHILLEEADPFLLDDHPLFCKARLALERGNLQVRRVNPSVAEIVEINFTVMDDCGYRFELDKTKAIASAAFGPSGMVKTLRDLFQSLWTTSVPLTLPAHA